MSFPDQTNAGQADAVTTEPSLQETRMRRPARAGTWALTAALAVGGVWATSPQTWGQEPGRLPEPPRTMLPGGGGPGGPGGPDGAGGPGGPRGPGGAGGPGGVGREAGPERLSEEELNRFRVFANAYMPNIATAIEEMPSPRARLWLRGAALFHYRRYERGRRDFPHLEERLLQDAREVDEMVRLAREFGTAPPDRQTAIRDEMRQRMLSVSRSVLAERRLRIERLRQQLEREEAALEREESTLDQELNPRMEEFLRFGGDGSGRRGPGGRGPGPGPEPGPGPRP